MVGVVGAGLMGCGVAHVAAQAGGRVVLVDVDDAALEEARASIVESVRLQKLLGAARGGPGVEEVLAAITLTTDCERLSDAGFVFEHVPERWEIKRDVLARVDQACPPQAIIASGTSAIPITRLASATQRPDRFLGIHFMNPVPLKPMVEMVPGFLTSESTMETARTLLAKMGKTPVVVKDSPGFVTNRVLMMTINEAVFLVQEGVASPQDVDRIFKGCFGHKMGPLETADMIGLDTVLDSIEVLHDSFGDSKYRPSPLLKQMVSAGLLGRKSGRGFHDYQRAAPACQTTPK